MKVKRVRLDTLNPAPYNPRRSLTPDDAEWKRIQRSIEEFGLVEPIVWNAKTNNIVGGHQRVRVMLAMGIEEAEVSVVELDDERERALNIALNKIAGEWDNAQLAAVLDSLDMDMALLTGYDHREIAGLLQRLETSSHLDAYLEEIGPASTPEGTRTRPGTTNDNGDYSQITYAVLPAQKKAILGAIKRARTKLAIDDVAAALTAVCEAYNPQ